MSINQRLEALLHSTNEQQLVIGVAEEIIYSIYEWNKFSNDFISRVDNPSMLEDIPQNTILARIISEKEYDSSGRLSVCYPMFPSHFQMPIKTGEQILIFRIGNENFWLSRLPSTNSVEDVNFTHNDRRFLISDQPGGISTQEDDEEKEIGQFNNGGVTDDLLSFNRGEYSDIFKTAVTQGSQTYEPVPRFLKRPGDLVLQGSNNSLICLGQERGWTKNQDVLGVFDSKNNKAPSKSNVNSTSGPRSATIDLVTGRGRFPPQPATELDDGTNPIRTAPRTIVNERRDINNSNGMLESLRFSELRNLEPNQCEGDPDLEYDAARILIGSSGMPDKLFSLSNDKENNSILPVIKFWKDSKREDYESKEKSPGGVFGSYCVSKADHIRLVARHQEKDVNGLLEGVGNINGTIRIIKEGIRDSEAGDGQAVILLQPDGTIMIDGPTVVIGSGVESLAKESGEGTQIVLGQGATEPLVLGNELKDLLDTHFTDVKNHIADLKTFLGSVFDTHTHGTGVGPSTPPLALSVALQTAITSTDTAVKASKDDLINILSKYGKTK
tara:strand:+ start:30459 stop:32123 length:1665 start_codon:yes stop_codon:yes gene_type:complete